MATKQPSVSDGANHGLSGRKVTVEFLKTQDQEPRDIFVGVGTYEASIKRGTQVTIPVEAFEVLRSATYLDQETDENDPAGLRKVWVEKTRFPYNVISRHD